MNVSFECFCTTKWGETLCLAGSAKQLGSWDPNHLVPMHCTAPNKWKVVINFSGSPKPNFNYKYVVKSADGQIQQWEPGKDRNFQTKNAKFKNIHIKDTWMQADANIAAWESSAFSNVILKPENSKKYLYPSNTTRVLEFKITAPNLGKNQEIAITGNCNALGNWNLAQAIPLNNSAFPEWKIAFDMALMPVDFEYKYIIITNHDTENCFWENTPNRHASLDNIVDDNSVYQINDGFFHYSESRLKGAGVSLPVFSIRTLQSFGTGDFTDLKLVFDWAHKTGLHMVQILPVNDTISTHTFLDSYPYKAISVFALHPLYLNIFKMGTLKDKKLAAEFKKLQLEYQKKESVDYDAVVKLKLKYSQLLYAEKSELLSKNKDYQEFLSKNKSWLEPYAAFSYLRDLYGTSDFTLWKKYRTYNASEIKELLSDSNPELHKIEIWYFIQFHLDMQLKQVSAYGRSKGIALKGDIPIGISRYSVDAWFEPRLYHFDGQAGAPPDDFSVDGQNWGFPTYNWEEMAKDNYQWWRKRLTKMAEYFDAYRIDHILGFFRIWEIPFHAVQGILGNFRPALPYASNELQWNGIELNYERFCKPYIRGHFLSHIFNEYAQEVIEKYLNESSYSVFELKKEFSTQRDIYNHFIKTGGPEDLTEKDRTIMWGLIRLAAEVLLLPDSENKELYHPRISMHSTYSYQELDGYLKEKLNQLYIHYFYHRHEQFWKEQALQKLPALVNATNMLICGEDLGMIPASVPEVMNQFGILSLEIQRMPKDPKKDFAHPADAPYLSVCTTSTHDMSTLRGWWEENREKSQLFYQQQLGKWETAPQFAEPWLCKEIFIQHLYSPAMWTIFPIQDLLAIDAELRLENPNEERINEPANPRHYWKYRMHLKMEDLNKAKDFNALIKYLVSESGRLIE